MKRTMTESSIQTVSILVLGRPDCSEDFTRWVDDHAHVVHVETFNDALEALKSEPFDIVISRAADFIPFQEAHFTGQAGAILDSVNQGVGIVGQSGELDWANPKLLNLSDEIREHVCKCCMETFTWAKAAVDAGSAQVRGRRFSFTSEQNECYEITATPVIDLHNRVTQVAAVIWDTTGSRRLQNKIDIIDQAGRELLSLDAEQFSRLDAQERLSLLEQKILRCTHDLLHFDNFVIFLLDKQTNRLEPVLIHGMTEDRAHTELYASSEGSGICGYVAARGRSYICPDTSRDSRYVVGIDYAQSSLSVPLTLHDKVIGVANFESVKLAAFNEDDRQFAEIFGRYIALSLHILELLVSERQTTTGQLGSNVMAQITSPLNDILTETETLVEDYIGHDDLRHRLRAISENAVKIRETIKEITSIQKGLLGVHNTSHPIKDPILYGKRILLADDEDIIRETIEDVLKGYGCKVCAVVDGSEAVAILKEQSFDLVLSDIKMPNKSGYEVFAAAKEANPDTPVVLTTGFGYDPNHAIVRARREGLAAVLFKPFKVDQLLTEIRNALQSKST